MCRHLAVILPAVCGLVSDVDVFAREVSPIDGDQQSGVCDEPCWIGIRTYAEACGDVIRTHDRNQRDNVKVHALSPSNWCTRLFP